MGGGSSVSQKGVFFWQAFFLLYFFFLFFWYDNHSKQKAHKKEHETEYLKKEKIHTVSAKGPTTQTTQSPQHIKKSHFFFSPLCPVFFLWEQE